jgi:DNA-binding winged helix-turn-helix (wHTH) protein
MIDENNEDIPVLIGLEGGIDGHRWMINHVVIIGRDANCEITIPNRQVSRHHAKISPTENGVFLEDLGSKNGTHHNGKPISEQIQLTDGDIIHIALAQKFVFMSADATLPLDPDETFMGPLFIPRRLRLEKRSRRVWIGDKEVLPPLSVSQFRLLETLYNKNGQLVPREEAVINVWGEDDAIGISEQALDALVRRLRDRLASLDPVHTYVVTVRGHGLRLDNPLVTGKEEINPNKRERDSS